MITLKTAAELASMRQAGAVVAQVLSMLKLNQARSNNRITKCPGRRGMSEKRGCSGIQKLSQPAWGETFSRCYMCFH